MMQRSLLASQSMGWWPGFLSLLTGAFAAAETPPQDQALVLGSHQETTRCCGTVLTACTNVKHVSCNAVKPLQKSNNDKTKPILNSSPHIDIAKKPASFILTNVLLLVAEGFIWFCSVFQDSAPITRCQSSLTAQ